MNPEQTQPPQIELREFELQQEQQPTEPPKKDIPVDGSRWQRFRHWYGSHKKWAIPATILVILLILAVVPWSRYKAAGVVIKKDFTIEVLDSAGRTPVSEATVKVGSLSSQTDGNGRAKLRLSAGRHTLLISKKYYQQQRTHVLVPIFRQKSAPIIEVDATGRQAKITIKNLISQKPLSDAGIKVADITAKTDKKGEAIVVLPVGTTEPKATISLGGYNNSEVSVKISDSTIAENNFTLTPAGKAYFMSSRTGKLDLMKANLDGSNPQVAVAGTGTERDHDTTILASPGNKYVALVTRRTTDYSTPQLYIVSTEDDKLLGVDNANAEFSIVGWSGDNLIYTVARNDLPDWQTGIYKLKSYDASSGKVTLLNQSTSEGDSTTSVYEYYDFVMISGESVLYVKNWYHSDEASKGLLDGKKNTLSTIKPAGQDYKQLAAYDARDSVQYVQLNPVAIYIYEKTTSSEKFYEYAIGAAAPTESNIDLAKFNEAHKTFYVSASAKKTVWADHRDGKYTIFLGGADGSNASEIAALIEYDLYGWFGDEYLLVTKDNSQLYIMSPEGGKPVKITDFQVTAAVGY